MAWDVLISAARVLLYAYSRIQKPQNQPPPSLDDLEAPTAEEGRSIPVLFGRRRIASPNVVWWGDLNTVSVRTKVKGLFGSKYQDTGQYKVYLGMHMVIGVGVFDSIERIEVGDKIAWEGYSAGGQIAIDNEWLFGGDKKQGGVVGYVDLDFGEPSQVANDYLVSQLGNDVPAYRGVVSAILRHVYLGTTTFIKPWAFWGARIHKKSDGSAQWYDEKAEIGQYYSSVNTNFFSINAASAAAAWNSSIGVTLGAEGIASPIKRYIGVGGVWQRWEEGNEGNIAIKYTIDFFVRDDYGTTHYFYPGETENEARLAFAEDYPNGIIELRASSFHQFYLIDDPVDDNSGGHIFTWSTTNIYYRGDMNPAHIIREALTDRKFALRYSDYQIDDNTFAEAADILFDEGMGMSLYWSSENTIEEFIGEVLRHIDGNSYVDKKTGKWVLKLIRDDYSLSDLLVLDEGNIVDVTSYKQPTISELVNSVTVVFWDYQTGEDGSTSVQDQTLVDLQGGIVNETLQYPGFTNHDIASRVAVRDLKARATPMISCTITCTRAAADLNIGDPFVLNWPDLDINNLVMRVESIRLGDLTKSEIVIDCVQDVFSAVSDSGESIISEPGIDFWTDPTLSTPEPASPRVVMEAPYLFATESFGPSDVLSGLDADPGFGINFIAAGRQNSETNATAQVNSGAGYVDAGVMGFSPWAQIENVSRTQTTVYITGGSKDLSVIEYPALASIEDEIVIVHSLGEDTSGEFFTISRGALDTVPAFHETNSSGSLYIVIWDSYAISDEFSYTNGNSNSVRLITTQTGAALDPSDAPVNLIDFASRAVRPYPPANLKINGEYWPSSITGDAEIAFRQRNRVLQTSGTDRDWFDDIDVTDESGQTYAYELYDADTNSLIETASGFSASPITISQSAMAANNRLEIFSERDGYQSFNRVVIEFLHSGADSNYFLTEANDIFTTESNDNFEAE